LGSAVAEQVLDLFGFLVGQEGDRPDQLGPDVAEVTGLCGLAIYAELSFAAAAIAGA
jgi:hypothetical protein